MSICRGIVWLFAVLALTGSALAGPVRITEFMANPPGTDADREWIEIYNDSSESIDISGWRIGDAPFAGATSTGEALFIFPQDTVIPPFAVWVIAQKAVDVDSAQSFNGLYGFKPNFEMAADTDPTVPNLIRDEAWSGAAPGTNYVGINNGSSGDDVVLTDADHNWIDGANHGPNDTFFAGAVLLGSGQSYERVPAIQDTDTIADWVVRPDNDSATPGVVTIPEPATLAALGLLTGLWFRRRHA